MTPISARASNEGAELSALTDMAETVPRPEPGATHQGHGADPRSRTSSDQAALPLEDFEPDPDDEDEPDDELPEEDDPDEDGVLEEDVEAAAGVLESDELLLEDEESELDDVEGAAVSEPVLPLVRESVR
jgi:hypothetical protein